MEQSNNLKRLDELIADFGGADTGMHSRGPCGLLSEHLRAARSALLGSRCAEYGLSLELATQAITCVTDKSARSRTKEILQTLIDSSALQRGSAAAAENPGPQKQQDDHH